MYLYFIFQTRATHSLFTTCEVFPSTNMAYLYVRPAVASRVCSTFLPLSTQVLVPIQYNEPLYNHLNGIIIVIPANALISSSQAATEKSLDSL